MNRTVVLILLLGALLLVAVTLGAQQTTDTSLNRYTTSDGLAELIEEGETPYLLVDVRTAAEYDGGHIPTAINVPFQVIAEQLPDAEGDPIIVVYCRSGRRSGIAFDTLRSRGYNRIVDFGGIVRWRGELER